MASLLGQIAAVLAVALLVRALAGRAGLTLRMPQATALAAVLVLALAAVSAYRETWHQLDLQRTAWKNNDQGAAISECAGSLGVDPLYVGWLRERIPEGQAFFQPPGPERGFAPDICLRMLLLPRFQVEEERRARYVVVWSERGRVDPALLDGYRRRGAKVERYTDARWLVTLP
jgi:hypothetical protein